MKHNELEYFFVTVLGIEKQKYESLADRFYSLLQATVLETLINVYFIRDKKIKASDISSSIIFEWLYDPYVINSFVLNLLFSKSFSIQDKIKTIKSLFKYHLKNLKVVRVSARIFDDMPIGFPTITLFYHIFRKKRYSEKVIATALKYDSLTNYHLPTIKKYFLAVMRRHDISENLKLQFLLSLAARLNAYKTPQKEGKKSFLQTALLMFYTEKTISVRLLLSLTREISLLLSMPNEMAVVLTMDKKVAKKDFPVLVQAQPWFMNLDSWNQLLRNFGAIFPSLVFELFTRLDDEEQKARLLLELGIIGTLPKSLFLSIYLDILTLLKPVYSVEILSMILQSLMQRSEDNEKKAIIEFGFTELKDKIFIELALKDKSSDIRAFARKLIKKSKKGGERVNG